MKSHVLVVDDQKDILEVVAEVLRLDGYEVDTASTPLEAMELLADAQQPYALLLTDVMMPHMDGVRLARSSQAQCPGLCVVFMTAWPSIALPAGCHLLHKPFRRQQLQQVLERVLRSA
jgi:two-component system cell cycle response regulator CpdR